MKRWEVEAYKQGCPFSADIIEYFENNLNSNIYHINKLERHQSAEHPIHPYFPRIYCHGELLFDCSSFFRALHYVKHRGSEPSWSTEELEEVARMSVNEGVSTKALQVAIVMMLRFPLPE